jgi:hypothetical protein
MTGLRSVQVTYAVAIPLGHTVHVTWYAWKPAGLPRIVDADTGVEYLPEALSSRTEDPDGGEAVVDRLGLDPSLGVREELSGIVRQCIVWATESGCTQTALTIEVRANAEPYR